MNYKLEYKIKGQHKSDFYITDNYNDLLVLFNQIKLDGGNINNIFIKNIEDIEIFTLYEINYDKEEFGNYYIKGIKVDSNGKENIDYFDISDIDEIELIKNDITNKFNIDLSSYYFKKKGISTTKIIYKEDGQYGILSKGTLKKKIKINSTPHYILKTSLEKDILSVIDFYDIIELIYPGDLTIKNKKIDNSVRFLNKDIEKKLKIKDFFKISNMGYYRQFEVECDVDFEENYVQSFY